MNTIPALSLPPPARMTARFGREPSVMAELRALQTEVLEAVAGGEKLPQVAALLCRLAEVLAPRLTFAVFRIEPTARCFHSRVRAWRRPT